MKYLGILFVLGSMVLNIDAQEILSLTNNKIIDKVVFLQFESSQIKYFEKGCYDEREPVTNKQSISLKHNFSNVYMNWLNPVRYKVSWKDSLYSDEMDQLVMDFITMLANQFGLPITDLKTQEYEELLTMAESFKDLDETELYLPVNGFNSLDLIELYLEICSDGLRIQNSIKHLNPLLILLDTIDNYFSYNIDESLESSFVSLYSLQHHQMVQSIIETERLNLLFLEEYFDKLYDYRDTLVGLTKSFNLNNNGIFTSYIKLKVDSFLTQLDKSILNDKQLIAKLTQILDQFEVSIINESQSHEGFFWIRDINIPEGKILETEITITEYDLDIENKDGKKKSDIYCSKIIFKKHDLVVPIISAGIFFSNTTLKGYGVSIDDGGNLIVSEDNITKNNPVVALFLNLNFNLESRYFAPLVQFGIDPTKKRPYLLLGAGFSIPMARFAVSGGPLWTWDASLTKLSEGDIINSSTDIENDIKYTFDGTPKGWYLGIQYNF